MPTSIQEGKQFIRDFVATVKSDRKLDIGCGEGTYAKMFPGGHWTGVEIFGPYVLDFGLDKIYDELIVQDARTVDFEGEYDLAFAGDVLEHMTGAEASELVLKLRRVANWTIISIPLGHHPQGMVHGNVNETHVEDWDDRKVRLMFGEPDKFYIDGIIGVYIYGKSTCKIPKKIHIVWVGDEDERPNDYIRSWQEKNPSWLVKIWGNEEYNRREWINKPAMEKFWAAGALHGVADLMRYEILLEEGGFCVDADSECVTPLDDDLFNENTVFVYENTATRPGLICVGYMASIPHTQLMFDIIASVRTTPVNEINVDHAWFSVGPRRLTDVFNSKKYENVKILPDYTFIPEHFDAPAYKGPGTVYARQYWLTTNKNKKKLRICVYAISKNEEKFIQRWAESAKEADLIVLADTGSTDRTVELAKECGVQTHSICITPWRFDHARNASIALIPGNIDVCVCIDVDEVLEPGWREEIERVWKKGETTRLRYYFDWGCGIKFMYEKIHARHGYYWHHPCHEYPRYDARIKEVYAFTDKLLVRHLPDPTKSRGQYLDLLKLSVDEDPVCPRNAFYYARELSFHGRWQDAINEANRYLKLPGATWHTERCYAYRVMSKCYQELGNLPEAEKALFMAASEAPNTREPWCALSLLMYQQKRWEESFTFALRTLKIENRELVYTCDPEVWGHQPHDLASIAAWNLGLKEIALKQAQLAVEKSPQDARLRANLNYIQEALA